MKLGGLNVVVDLSCDRMWKSFPNGVAHAPSEGVSNSFKQVALERIAKRALAVAFHFDIPFSLWAKGLMS